MSWEYLEKMKAKILNELKIKKNECNWKNCRD